MHSLRSFVLSTALVATPLAAQAEDFTLPDGFTATVFAEGLGPARQAVVSADGTVYVGFRTEQVMALRDTDGDGVADEEATMATPEETAGIDLHDGYLYVAGYTAVHRVKLDGDGLLPDAAPEEIVNGFKRERQHGMKTFVISPDGDLFVNNGAPSNACQETMRTPGSPGMRPCPILEEFAGIWRFDAATEGQDFKRDGELHSTGIRNAVAIDWSTANNGLYFANHGRDQLDTLWPDLFTAEQNRELPAEYFTRSDAGDHHGWPYTYWDHQRGERMVNPEYGGDGKTASDEDIYTDPIAAFPGHWGPNDLVFYEGTQAFPAAYKDGAFIAFHGSWNRAPFPQAGYNVMFVPFEDGQVSGEPWTFAEGFEGAEELRSPRDAVYRPTGLAVGPDGALFIVDSMKGRIWRVTYTG